MADPVSLYSMPRLRRAWLQEIGVESLWPGPRPPASPTSPLQSGQASVDLASSEPVAIEKAEAKVEAMPPTVEAVQAISSAAFVAEPLSAKPAAPAVQAPARAETVTSSLQLRTYVGEGAGTCRWLVVVDANDFADPQAGASAFLQNLMRAMQLQAEEVAALPLDGDEPAMQAGRVPPGRMPPQAVLAFGRAARRALVLRARIGHIAQVDVGHGPVPAMALPAASDITASAAGKAYVWRALRALADAAAA